MATISVDGIEIEIADGERLNCIQAADRAGVEIPFYCWHPGLSVVASCRMCLVETGTKGPDGKVQMGPKLAPACQTPAMHGTVIVTNSEKVRANQRFVQEYLLVDHPIDCPICDQAGECWLQDYYFRYGQAQRRADVRPFTSRRKDVGEHVTLFIDRCVMCSRCVRFTREISGTGELAVVERGHHAEIDVFPGRPCDNKLSGNVVDLCPVGALCSKDFLYKQRAWFLKSHPSVCTRCSTGCSIVVDENKDTIYRLRPRYNPNANDWWMCDIGRYGFDYVHSPQRLTTLSRRGDGILQEIGWEEAMPAVRKALAEAVNTHGAEAVAAVLSPFLTCEEAYLLGRAAKRLSPKTVLVLGPVPVAGHDETYPRGFVIRAERCPNRRGVSEVLRHFEGEVLDFPSFLARVRLGQIKAVYLTGGYPEAWISLEEAESLEQLELLVVQDILPSPVSRMADFVLPGASFAEKEGSYVNHGGLLQVSQRAIRPPGACHVDGQVFWDLQERRGLYGASVVRQELAAAIPLFAAAAEEIPEYGVRLGEGGKADGVRPVPTTWPGTVLQPIPDARAPGAPHPGR
ncbi:MAG: molybdopterin-dependent oxidoreductase [Planctomycetes bacterium]|nr:molybdopterin-dependent oxidoreductase [Planctomycetota bacterium]